MLTHPTRSHFVVGLVQHVLFDAVTVITILLFSSGGGGIPKQENETERSLGLCRVVCPAPELEHPKSLK